MQEVHARGDMHPERPLKVHDGAIPRLRHALLIGDAVARIRSARKQTTTHTAKASGIIVPTITSRTRLTRNNLGGNLKICLCDVLLNRDHLRVWSGSRQVLLGVIGSVIGRNGVVLVWILRQSGSGGLCDAHDPRDGDVHELRDVVRHAAQCMASVGVPCGVPCLVSARLFNKAQRSSQAHSPPSTPMVQEQQAVEARLYNI
mmetsp:Transcript_72860/g.184170  ORF Transcript_72860/g.184170 Transcript_72860/m.184170 type:complete len:202 (+) Transcript_72860:184-789(+)